MKLMALDGNSVINRAYYGVKPLSTSQGVFTNAIFGFINILQRLIDEDQPDALCVTFDLKGPTFRHEAFADYKGKRKPMPEELAMQMPLMKEVLAAMNIPMYAMSGWEADDLLGTISRRCEGEGWDCVLVTGDKDALQLVTDRTHIKLITTARGQTNTTEFTPELFRTEYGFDPIHLIDLKALMGDNSDNYPGVPGIGEKTALALVQSWQTVDGLYANLDNAELKPAQRKKLEAGYASARLCLDLATIRTDAPMDFRPQDCIRKEWNNPEVYRLFLQLEFKKLIERYQLHPEEAASVPEERILPQEVILLEEEAPLQAAIQCWQGLDYVVVVPQPNLEAVSVACTEDGKCRVYHLERDTFRGDYAEAMRKLFSDSVPKLAHCVKELCNLLLATGMPAEGFVYDTALEAYLLEPTAGGYAPDVLVMHYFQKEIPASPAYLQEEALGLLEDKEPVRTSRQEVAVWLDALHRHMKPMLKEQGMLQLLTELEVPLCRVLAEMELAGVLIDRQALADYGIMLEEGIRQKQEEIYGFAGKEFNINSPKQLGVVLFEDLGLPVYKKTKTGYSTNADVLDRLKTRHPIIGSILEYRQLTKLRSTYVEGLMKVIAVDGRIHTSFQNTVTATGRLSSVEPNLQNIPVRTPLGAKMRYMFIAAPGNVLVDADYSQIELRLLAHIAQDQVMQEGFRAGADIHTMTAAQVFGVPEELVTKSMRSSAKAVNFGIVYGISEFSLAQDIGVSRTEAKAYMERYFATYSGVHSYMKAVVEQARQNGYVSTVMGRRRPLPEIQSANFNQRSFGERVALNAPIQGTAADIIKLAMIRVQNRLKEEGLTGRLVLQVHDELIVECPEAEGEQVRNILKEEMEAVFPLDIPLVADGAIGKCWADAH